MIKILIGGSPCTFWSIAQKNNRETEAEGLGWELFKNYLIAKEKFKPDLFLYENNKSAAKPIKEQISKELGVELMHINSALVSAQNRQRFYAFNWEVEQPADRGILLKDVLETTPYDAVQIGYRNRREEDGKLYRRFETHGEEKSNALTTVQTDSMVAEPIRVGQLANGSQGDRVYSIDGKSVGIKANGGGWGAKTGLYAVPICHTIPQEVRVRKYTCDIEKLKALLREHKNMSNKEIAEKLGKPVTLVEHWFRKDNCFSVPDEDVWFKLKDLLNIETTEFDDFVTVFEVKEGVFEKSHRCYDVNGKMSTLMTGKTDNIIEPVSAAEVEKLRVREATKKGYTEIEPGDCVDMTQPNSKTRRGRNMKDKCNCLMTGNQYYQYIGTVDEPIYEVKDGQIEIKDKKYPIKLLDGYYIIRKLTPVECERLQTLPDGYTEGVSNTQRYKGLGNGWTAEVIIHILQGALKDVPKDEEIVVLSMYDGIGTGRYCLDKMGFTNVKYFAYEIDKYAKEVAMKNYPDIIQMGDAFDLRHPDWTIGY